MSHRIARRAILRGLGGTALALPFLASWRGDSGWGVFNVPTALAAGGKTPKRVVFIVNQLGSLYEYFTPRNTSADGKSFDLAEIMQPFAAYKNRLAVLTGVNMASVKWQDEHGGLGFGPHNDGSAHVLSSQSYNRSPVPWGEGWPYARPKTPSIDQAIASFLGKDTRFASLCVGDAPPEGQGVFVATGNDQDLSRSNSPQAIYDRVFKDFEGDPKEQERRTKGKLAAVSNALPAYKHLSTRLSARDKLILDQHMDSLSDIEKRLKLTSACVKPSKPDPSKQYYVNGEFRNPDGPPEGPYDDLYALAAVALGCDMTRVMVLGISGQAADTAAMVPKHKDYFSGGLPNFHELSHAEPGQTAMINGFRDALIWRSTKLAKFVDKLATTVDTDGRMMLDNTIIVHTSEMITGAHDLLANSQRAWFGSPGPSKPVGLPMFVIGPTDGPLKSGIHLNLTGTDTYGTSLGKYSHGEVFLTIARAMGITEAQMPTFGNPEVCKRVVSELLA